MTDRWECPYCGRTLIRTKVKRIDTVVRLEPKLRQRTTKKLPKKRK
jgi:hypothetical protein